MFVCYATVPLCARRAANPPWSLLRVGPNPTGPVYVFTTPFNSSRMRMWSWHADRPNHQSSSSPFYTHHTHAHSRQNITHCPERPVSTCPSFILTKTWPTMLLSCISKFWLTSLITLMSPCCQYSLPHFMYTPFFLPLSPSPPSPRLTCVCEPTGCLWSLACLPFSMKALGFHTLPALFGECRAPSWQVDTGISMPLLSLTNLCVYSPKIWFCQNL